MRIDGGTGRSSRRPSSLSELEAGEGGPEGRSEDDWIKTNRIDHKEAHGGGRSRGRGKTRKAVGVEKLFEEELFVLPCRFRSPRMFY